MERIFTPLWKYGNYIQQTFQNQWGDYALLGMLASGIIIIFCLEKNRSRKITFGVYPLFCLVLLFNPASMFIINKIFSEEIALSMQKFLFIIPVIFSTAYSFTLLIKELKGIRKQVSILCTLFFVIMGGCFHISALYASGLENLSSTAKENWMKDVNDTNSPDEQPAQVSEWLLTQYPDDFGMQSMFYSLYHKSSDTFIIIDGGWAENESQVRELIAQHNNHVDAWYVTHFHADHVAALNAILSSPQGVTIDHIYAPPIDYDYYIEVAKDWDLPNTYTDFITFVNSWNRDKNVLRYVIEGDTFSYPNLEISIYHSWEDRMLHNEKYDDIPNNASLVIKVQAPTDSILFLADCHSPWVGEELLDHYTKEELSSTYLQVGHHGSSSLPREFYESLSLPQTALFPAPEWLMMSTDHDVKDLAAYFRVNEIDVVDHSKGATSFPLK